MMLKNTENVIVVDPANPASPFGIARANDILQLRRWLMEEEMREGKTRAPRQESGAIP